jgi:DDE superfamily endonuclease
VKNNVLCDDEQYIHYLSPTEVGSKHDKRIADENPLVLPPDSTLKQDLGFLGHHPADVDVEIPYKGSKKKPLSFAQTIYNRLVNSTRVVIEHVNSGIKRLHIVKYTIRLYDHDTRDLVMLLACGLHNFRVKSEHRAYATRA